MGGISLQLNSSMWGILPHTRWAVFGASRAVFLLEPELPRTRGVGRQDPGDVGRALGSGVLKASLPRGTGQDA